MLLVPASAHATALELYGFGPRASAMGMAATASVDGAEALYYNPAAVASLENIRLSVGYRFSPTKLTINGEEIGSRQVRSTELGLGFGLSTFGRKSGLAIALHVPDAGLYAVRLRPVSSPQFVLVDPRRDRIHVMAGFAISPIDKVEIGAGASLLSDTLAKLSINQGAEETGEIDAQLIPTNTLHAGLRVGPWAGTRIGLAYREEHISILSFPSELNANLGGVDGTVTIYSRTFTYFTPRQLALGGSWDGGAWTLSGDLVWSQWSGMRDPAGRGRIVIIDRSYNLPSESPGHEPEDPGFKDTIAPRVGTEVRLRQATSSPVRVRFGAAFDPTPAPTPSPSRNLIDSDRVTVTGGVGVTFKNPRLLTGPFDIDLHATYSKMADRTIVRNDPTDPVGSFTASGELFDVGLAATFRFDAPYLRN